MIPEPKPALIMIDRTENGSTFIGVMNDTTEHANTAMHQSFYDHLQ